MKMLLALLLKHSLTSPFFQHQEKGHQKPKELYQANPIYRRPKKQLVMSSEMLLKELLNTQFSDPGLRQTPCWRVTFWTKWWLLPAKQSTVRSREAMHWICWPNLFTHNSTEAIHEHSSRVWTSYTCSEQSIRKITSSHSINFSINQTHSTDRIDPWVSPRNRSLLATRRWRIE